MGTERATEAIVKTAFDFIHLTTAMRSVARFAGFKVFRATDPRAYAEGHYLAPLRCSLMTTRDLYEVNRPIKVDISAEAVTARLRDMSEEVAK